MNKLKNVANLVMDIVMFTIGLLVINLIPFIDFKVNGFTKFFWFSMIMEAVSIFYGVKLILKNHEERKLQKIFLSIEKCYCIVMKNTTSHY